MNTQQLLELAAQSIDLDYEWQHDRYYGGEIGVVPKGYLRTWNPLRRNDDMVELIAKLRLNVNWGQYNDQREVVAVEQAITGLGQIVEPVTDDPEIQLRQTVTRSAAQIQLEHNPKIM